MLRIHEVTSATDAKRYYASADYYAEGQEVLGHWGGTLADRLGLQGTVDRASFERLCDNLHPFTEKSLTPRTNAHRRVGYDLVFSTPKSFSILEALAPPEERARLLAAFDEAVTETMERDVEPDMQTRERKNGADFDRRTGNIVWAEFDHSTARPVGEHPPDMHRHKHVLVFNATYDPAERRIKAGQFGSIKRDGEYYAAAFYARLAGKLEAMGYAIDRRGGKAWEIAHLPQSIIDTFAKRTEEVEAEHAERLRSDPDYRPEDKHELGAKTRSKKQKELTPAELRAAWAAQLTDAERDALAVVYRKEHGRSATVTAADAVKFAIAHGSEQHSVLPEREWKRLALLHGLGHVSPDEIAAELPKHGVVAKETDGRLMATTKALLAEERRIVGFAANGRGSVLPIGVAEGLSRELPGGKKLNDGQWRATIGLLQSSNRVNAVLGPAGAGKSYLLRKFDEGVRAAGQSVTFLAATSDAAGVLSSDGHAAMTVARFLVDEKAQKAARGNRVVVDEASLLGHRDAVRLVEVAERENLKLIFVGDKMQHGAVPRGALLQLLEKHAGIIPFRLTEIRRQEDAGYLAAVKLLAEGQTAEGLDAIDRMGWVHEVGDEAERMQRAAAEYVQALADKKSVLCISPTHREAARLTQEIRGQLKAAGLLGKEEREFTRLVAVNASEAERQLATTYKRGQVVEFTQNAKGYKKGQRLVVDDPKALPLEHAGKFQLYDAVPISLAAGDKLRITAGLKSLDGKHRLTNGMVRTVSGFTARGIVLDNGWVVGKDAGHFRHGFVDTSFASQGKTVQRAILSVSADSLAATNQEQAYVSSSRAKERLTIFTDDKAELTRAAGRSSRKLAALDLLPQAKPAGRLRSLLAKRRRQVVERLKAAWEEHVQPERQVSRGRG